MPTFTTLIQHSTKSPVTALNLEDIKGIQTGKEEVNAHYLEMT